RDPALLTARYGFSLEGLDATGVLEAVAKRRSCVLKGRGGELDLEKAAMIFLTDYRSGALGRISLETPATRQAMLDAARSKAKQEAARKKAELDAARNQAALDAEHNKGIPSTNDEPDAVE
ncbi:MAG: hypothetical protein Q7T90_01605, partial [Thiobacillus sp.]|nr:hypothetical protein [Thiobacillus sp.]